MQHYDITTKYMLSREKFGGMKHMYIGEWANLNQLEGKILVNNLYVSINYPDNFLCDER